MEIPFVVEHLEAIRNAEDAIHSIEMGQELWLQDALGEEMYEEYCGVAQDNENRIAHYKERIAELKEELAPAVIESRESQTGDNVNLIAVYTPPTYRYDKDKLDGLSLALPEIEGCRIDVPARVIVRKKKNGS